MFIIKILISSQGNQINFTNIRELRAYDLPVKYAKKSFGQSFFDYLGPNFFN